MTSIVPLRILLVLAAVAPGVMQAQADTADPLRDARRELAARRLGQATALLSAAIRDTHVAASRRAQAFVLLGVIEYYQGKDDDAVGAFRSALTLDPYTNPPAVVFQDSILGHLWTSQQAWAAAVLPPDTVFTCLPDCVGLDSAPSPLHRVGPMKMSIEANRSMQENGFSPDLAIVVLRYTIDTTGRVEAGSVEVVSSTLPRGMLEAQLADARANRYRPGRAHGRAVRVRVETRVTIHEPLDTLR